MRPWTTIALAFLTLMTGSVGTPEAFGQAGSVGLGWCPVCQQDVWLSTHDFTHGRHRPRPPQAGGGARRVEPAGTASDMPANQRRALEAYFRGLELWNGNDPYGAIRQLEYAVQQDPGNTVIRDKLRYFQREHADLRSSGEMYHSALRLIASGELDKAISDLKLAESRLTHGDTDFACQIRDELKRATALNETRIAAIRAEIESQRQESLRGFRQVIEESLASFPDASDDPGLNFNDPLADTDKPPVQGDSEATMTFPPLDDAQWLFEKGIQGSPPVDLRTAGPSRLDADPFLEIPVVAADLLRVELNIASQTFGRDESGDVRFDQEATGLFTPDRVAQDTKALVPPDPSEFLRLDEKSAIQLLVARHEAAEAASRRWELQELTARLNRLVREVGDTKTDLLTLEQTNPKFASGVKEAVEQVRQESQARLHDLYTTDLELLASRTAAARREEAAVRYGEITERAIRQEREALAANRAKFYEQAVAIVRTAEAEGLLVGIKSPEDLKQRESSTPRLAAAMQEIARIGDLMEATEHEIRTQTFDKWISDLSK